MEGVLVWLGIIDGDNVCSAGGDRGSSAALLITIWSSTDSDGMKASVKKFVWIETSLVAVES